MVAAPTFSIPFFDSPAFFSGTAQTNVVPSVYPVAINGRPYLIDMKSGRYVRSHEQRVRDSQDTSTAPGEAAINPGGLWRRGQDSWHLGAGQQYADTAEAKDYMFYKSKGINPWIKGQVSLLNTTALNVGSGAPTTAAKQLMCVAGGYIYVADGQSLKRASTGSGSWTTISTGAQAKDIESLCSDGTRVFIGYATDSVYVHDSAGTSISSHTTGSHTFTSLAYANGRIIGTQANIIMDVSTAGGGTTIHTNRNAAMRFVGSAGGNGFIYIAGFAGDISLIYKTTLKAEATALDDCSVAGQLPYGEIVSSIDSYLGFIFIGTNKGIRMATTDASGNLLLGSVIPTSGSVNDFTGDGRFVWFTWTNYDGTSSGLGRLDLSVNTSANTPAFATDLMYTNTGVVQSVVTFDSKRVFSINGIGVVAENTTTVVPSGEIEFGTHRWGIPDRKFVAKFDVRTEPLLGSVAAYISNDHSGYTLLGTFPDQSGIEYTYQGTDTKTIEADFKLVLTKGTVKLTDSPIVTRWMARAYAAPFRSEVFSIPVLLHTKIRPRDRDIYMDPEAELDNLNSLIRNPRIVTLQLGTTSYSVITEDVEWQPTDSTGNTWSWDGTATVTMRSVEN